MDETHKKFNLRVTKDKMAVLLDCDVIKDEFDALISAIGNEFEVLGMKDPPSQEQLKKHLHCVAEKNTHLVDIVITKGEPPIPPQDGRVEWDGDFFNTGFVADKETGKVDYREKAAHESVIKGALLGHQIPVKKGKDGLNVFGEPILAEGPKTYYPEIGENVRFDTNRNAYYAEESGRVRLVNDTLFVDEVYTIRKDVDITTGNILHTGSVVVNRDVLGGAKIEAAGDIEVGGIIENAEIRAGGNLVVRGGIRQSEGHRVVVEGSINAKYINGGYIQANQDIVVEREIVNSTLHTFGAVMIPRGCIVGGEIVALRGIYVGRAGIKTYTPTVLVAGEDFNVRNRISFIKNKLESKETELELFKNYAGSQIPKHKATFIHSQDQLTKTLLKISELERELQNLVDELKEIETKTLSRSKKSIMVEYTLFPQTVICLGDYRLSVEQEYSGPIKIEIIDGEIKLNRCDNFN